MIKSYQIVRTCIVYFDMILCLFTSYNSNVKLNSNKLPQKIQAWLFFSADKRFEINAVEGGYEVDMRLKIKKVGRSTFGTYSCISKNSLGDTDGTIKLYCKYQNKSMPNVVKISRIQLFFYNITFNQSRWSNTVSTELETQSVLLTIKHQVQAALAEGLVEAVILSICDGYIRVFMPFAVEGA